MGLGGSKLIKYVVRRLVMLLPIYMAVTLITFVLLHAIPGDPAIAYFGETPGVPPEIIEEFRRRMGLDQPVYIQYLHFF
jgi:ABC-type dipeptide/oligopeptide/nickel transport system permease component